MKEWMITLSWRIEQMKSEFQSKFVVLDSLFGWLKKNFFSK